MGRVKEKIGAMARGFLRSPLAPILFLAIGLYWMVLTPTLLSSTYIDENALLPSSGTPVLTRKTCNELLETLSADETYSGFLSTPRPSLLHALLERWTGVPFYVHSYTLHAGGEESAPVVAAGKSVYGVYKPPRSDGKEAILLSMTYKDASSLSGLDTLLVLLSGIQDITWLSRSVVVVVSFPPAGDIGIPSMLSDSIGLDVWLNAYHGVGVEKGSDAGGYVRYPVLETHGGAFIASLGIALSEADQSQSFSLDVIGVNGLLPNQDFVNVAVMASTSSGLSPRIHARSTHLPPATWLVSWGILSSRQAQHLSNMVSFLALQASSLPIAPTGVAGHHAIPSLSIQSSARDSASSAGSGRHQGPHSVYHASTVFMVATAYFRILRPLSNLLEAFHASYRLFIMASTSLFISYGDYVWPIAVVVASVGVSALGTYLGMDGSKPLSGSLGFSAISLWACYHVISVLSLSAYVPLARMMTEMGAPALDLPVEYGPMLATGLLLLAAPGAATLAQVFVIRQMDLYSSRDALWKITRTIVLLEAVWTTVCVSLLNLGLAIAFIFAILLFHVPYVPFTSPSGSSSLALRVLTGIQLGPILIGSPGVLGALCAIFFLPGGSLTDVLASASSATLVQWMYQPVMVYFVMVMVYLPINLAYLSTFITTALT